MKETPILPQELALPFRVIFGTGTAERLLVEASVFGAKGIIAHGRSAEESGILSHILSSKPAGTTVLCWRYSGGEPCLSHVEELRQTALDFETNWIAALGGGSVIDTAKAAAGLLGTKQAVMEYHNGSPLPHSSTPFVAVPTTAGTGSEATSVCVLINQQTGVKKSFRHPSFLARLVILDPLLLKTCPPQVIASSGMDALTQALESFTSNYATWFTDNLALKAIKLLSLALPAAFEQRTANYLQDLAVGSFLAGVCLSHARLGIVHGLAHPLGARYHVPHGLVCAACLPVAVEFNKPAMDAKYKILSDMLEEDLLVWICRLTKRIGISSPFYGAPIKDPDGIIEETLASGSTKANTRPVTSEDVIWFLSRLFRDDAASC